MNFVCDRLVPSPPRGGGLGWGGVPRPDLTRERATERGKTFAGILAVAVTLAACAQGGGGTSGGGDARQPIGVRPVEQRPMVVAFAREPEALEPSLLPQNREESALTAGFLAYFTPQQQPMPYLAAELPSIEKGSWVAFPDGRMQTTYKLRSDATWHDGLPVEAEDWVFALKVRVDPEFPVRNAPLERKISRAEALDAHTLFLEWNEPYLWAGMVPLPYFAPMHRAKLEPMYLEDKEAFISGPHWREEYVGAGPYRIVRWEPGVEMLFQAHETFLLGKPAIPQIRVKFVPDSNTMVAGLLSRGLDVAFAIGLGFPQALALEQANWDGKVEYWAGNPRILEYQARDWGNTQRAVFDVRVRRATLHAVDRRGIVDEIFAGKSRVQHFWLDASDPAFPAVDRAVPKYEYDPVRADALLREAGWVKGADGMARNAAGEPLHLGLLNQPTDLDQQEAAVVASNWKAIGIETEIQRLSSLQLQDGELRSKYPGVAYNRRAMTLENLVWNAVGLATANNRWSGQNRNGYVNPLLDEAWGRVLGSVDPRDRERELIVALRLMADDAVVVPTHTQPAPTAYAAGIVGPKEPSVVGTAVFWNVWEWRWQ